MTPDALLLEALQGHLSPAAQSALVAALCEHALSGAPLDEALGLRSGGPGRNPRTQVLQALRDAVLRQLWADLSAFPPVSRSEVLRDLLLRRQGATDTPADDVEASADRFWMFSPSAPSPNRIRRLCAAREGTP